MSTNEIKLPAGFRFAGVHCGIKSDEKLDLALIVADQPSVCAGVYTQNLVRAASIDWNRAITPSSKVQAIAINSGNANACTGSLGVANNRAMAAAVASVISVEANQIPVLSTGVIGHQLPLEKILVGIATASQSLGNGPRDFKLASEAILTTDQGTKIETACFNSADTEFRIAGMAKGAGMIGPKMATMLSVIVTDAGMDAETADQMLRAAADSSFNCISVEGHTSTNDAVLLFCSGKAGQLVGEQKEAFAAHLLKLCTDLAKKIPSDGEGATHLIDISVQGAQNNEQADAVARTVAASNLVKTAITGCDPNWGRIVSAAGYSGATFDPSLVGLKINGHCVYENGTPVEFDEAVVSHAIRDQFETRIELTVGNGGGAAQHWTSDLTHDYVTLNAEYTT